MLWHQINISARDINIASCVLVHIWDTALWGPLAPLAWFYGHNTYLIWARSWVLVLGAEYIAGVHYLAFECFQQIIFIQYNFNMATNDQNDTKALSVLVCLKLLANNFLSE